jgi:hypothetical protein
MMSIVSRMRPALMLALAAALMQPALACGRAHLCTGNEQVLWSCSAQKQVHSLCASADLSTSDGYLQYRAGTTTKAATFSFPAKRVHPKGHFTAATLPRGVSLSFTHEGRGYWIGESIGSPTTIEVTAEGKPAHVITCRSATETLSLTTTISRFRSIGIME